MSGKMNYVFQSDLTNSLLNLCKADIPPLWTQICHCTERQTGDIYASAGVSHIRGALLFWRIITDLFPCSVKEVVTPHSPAHRISSTSYKHTLRLNYEFARNQLRTDANKYCFLPTQQLKLAMKMNLILKITVITNSLCLDRSLVYFTDNLNVSVKKSKCEQCVFYGLFIQPQHCSYSRNIVLVSCTTTDLY